jgi:hypothetical protein
MRFKIFYKTRIDLLFVLNIILFINIFYISSYSKEDINLINDNAILTDSIIRYNNKNNAVKTHDTTEFRNLNELNKTSYDTLKKFQMAKSTWGAVWRSLVFPGWGQLYVENYWKAPLFAGTAGALIYGIIYYNSKYNDMQNMMDNESALANPNQFYIMILKNKREFYRDSRDVNGFYLVAVYILASVDAYVGAHLYDFDVSDDLSINLNPNKFGYLSLNLCYRIK